MISTTAHYFKKKITIVECQEIPIPTTQSLTLSGNRLDVTFHQAGLYGVVVPGGSDQPFSCVVTTGFETKTKLLLFCIFRLISERQQ